MTKFRLPKSIEELAGIAQGIECIGIERCVESNYEGYNQFMVTWQSAYGEMTSRMYDCRDVIPDDDMNFIKSWVRTTSAYNWDRTTVENTIMRLGNLFPYPIYSYDVFDILDYITND